MTGLGARVRNYRGLFDHRVWVLTYGQVVSSFGKGFLFPVMAIYFYNEKGLPLTGIGAGFLILSVVSFFSSLVTGALADRYGRKPFMLIGLAGAGTAIFSFAFVDTLGQFFLVSALEGLVANAFGVSSRAAIADITPEDRRVRAYGLLYMANNLGLSLGLVVGGPMLVLLGIRTAFFVEATAHFAFFALVLLLVPETFTRAEGPAPKAREALATLGRDLRVPLADRVFLLFIGVQVLVAPAWSTFYNVLNPYLLNYAHLPVSLIGPIVAVNTVMVVLLQIPIAAFAEKRQNLRVLILAHYLIAWSMLGFWLAARAGGGVWMAAAIAGLACAVYTLGEILVSPVIPALVSGLAGSSRNYGKYLSFIDIVWMLGGGIGGVIGGAFFDAGRAGLLWPTFAALALLNMGGLILLRRAMDARMQQRQAPGAIEAPPAGDAVFAAAAGER